ncbi:MAG: hypothetical protein WCO28_01990 [Bacteroidota bacterium]
MKREETIFYSGLLFYTLTLLALALFTNGMAGGGDSIYHYLFAKYSWTYHEIFFDHWAKPAFTIISSPFAQFGYQGVKVFNVLVAILACYFTFKTAKQLSIRNAFLVVFFYFSATFNVTITLSALTEPLFALVLILSIYFYVKQKPLAGTLIISFLPFVRSEGLVVLCVFVVYLLLTKKFKFIPLLLAGHFIMGVAGYFYYGDILWVFNKIPYAENFHNYGSGTWEHFIIQLEFMIGPILYSLLALGGIGFIVSIKKNYQEQYFIEKLILLYGVFIGFFFAHSAFWALGIFNSLGLSRVFVGVMPLMAIISIEGLNVITQLFKNELTRKIVFVFLVSAVLIFPFLKNPASFNFKNDFGYNNGQLMIKEQIIPYLQTKYPSCKIYSSVVDFPFYMNIDPINRSLYAEFKHLKPDYILKQNEVAIWDNWSAVVEEHVSEQTLRDYLKADTVFQITNDGGDVKRYVIFVKK